jgi:hypothetical protein
MTKSLIERLREAGHRTPGAPRAVGGTRTTPDIEQGGASLGPNAVTALLLYGTDTLHLLPRGLKSVTIGSAPDQNIAIHSPFVSAHHCRLDRRRAKLSVRDVGSKNGTFFEGEREQKFDLKPGKTFIVGARPHRFLALNDEMRTAYPALTDIVGIESEHVIGGARETPSPSDVIVAATHGANMLITSEPDCDQARLARLIHGISLQRTRPIVELDRQRIPADRKAQNEIIKGAARRSTLVLDLGADAKPIDPAVVATLFATRHRIRVVVLARTVDVADKALGEPHVRPMQHLWLRPVASRPEAILHLLDRMFEEHNSLLRVMHLTADNQDALRAHDWPHNFRSLREAAMWLTTIYRHGSTHKAAQTLGIPQATLYHWYSRTLGLRRPLSFHQHKSAVGE